MGFYAACLHRADWLCKVCGLCLICCQCEGDTVTHVQSLEGQIALRRASRLRREPKPDPLQTSLI